MTNHRRLAVAVLIPISALLSGCLAKDEADDAPVEESRYTTGAEITDHQFEAIRHLLQKMEAAERSACTWNETCEVGPSCEETTLPIVPDTREEFVHAFTELPEHLADFYDCFYSSLIENSNVLVQDADAAGRCFDEASDCDPAKAEECANLQTRHTGAYWAQCYPAHDSIRAFCEDLGAWREECGSPPEPSEWIDVDSCVVEQTMLTYSFFSCWNEEFDPAVAARWDQAIQLQMEELSDCLAELPCSLESDWENCPLTEDLKAEYEYLLDGCPADSLPLYDKKPFSPVTRNALGYDPRL